MSNWGTMVYDIARSARINELINDTAPAGSVTNDVKRAIIEALEVCRPIPTWFNIKSLSISTVADKHYYDLPQDYQGLVGNVYYTPEPSTEGDSTRFVMREMGRDAIEEMRLAGDEYQTWDNKGRPLWYGVDITDGVGDSGERSIKLLLAPCPDVTGDLVDVRYVRDLGTPTYSVSGSTMTISLPDGQAISDSFTTEWLRSGRHIVREYALFVLWSETLGGSQETDARASVHRLRFEEMKNRVISEGNRMTSRREIRRYI